MRSSRRKIILAAVLSLSIIYPVLSREFQYSFNRQDRDPLVPLISRKGLILIPRELDFTGLSLKGIIYSQEQPLAIINDEVLKEGDSIGDYIILEIDEEKVVLKKGNEGFILKLEE